MTAKEFKQFKLFKEVTKLNVFTENKEFRELVAEAIALDYNFAVDIWEFLILESANVLEKDTALAIVLCDHIAEIFESTVPQRYLKTLDENTNIRRAAYFYSPCCFTRKASIRHIVDYLVSAKLTNAGTLLNVAAKNTSNKKDFADFLKTIMEGLAAELKNKSEIGKVQLSAKVSDFLLSYIDKLKAADRALLTQRLKEMM